MNPRNIVTRSPTVEYQDKRYTINRLIKVVEEEDPNIGNLLFHTI